MRQIQCRKFRIENILVRLLLYKQSKDIYTSVIYKKDMILDAIVIIVTLFLVAALCIHHHSMRVITDKTADSECSIIQRAAEHSIMASNTVNPILSLVEVTKAVQLIESIHMKYGPDTIDRACDVDTSEMLDILQNQKNRITQDVMRKVPAFIPPHPLNVQAGVVSSDNVSLEADILVTK